MLVFTIKLACLAVVLTFLYNLFIFVKFFRIYCFSWSVNKKARWLVLLPFAGNAYVALFTGIKVNMLSSLLFAERYFGLPVCYWFGHLCHYMSKSAEDAKVLLNNPKCLDKAQLYGDVQYVFKNSILLIPGEQWKGRRRYLRSAFNTGIINQFIPTLYQQSCLLLDRIKMKRAEDDHFKFFNTHAFMGFFLTSLGWMEEDVQTSEVVKFADMVDKVQDEFIKLLVNPIIPVSVWIKTPPGANLQKYSKELKRILTDILIRKKEQMSNATAFVDKKTDLPLVELLLNESYGANEESDVFEEFTLFAAAATDTTGHSLAFIFILLGMHPDVQQQVFDEVVSTIAGKEIDTLDLEKLIYTEAVISEVMRILPSIPLIGRYCSEDIEFEDKVIPKGTNVFISIFHIHRNPDYWEDPLKFDPTRFLPENQSKIISGSYLPFSSGPRNCIGQRMAMVSLKMTVANVVRNFQIYSSHKSMKEFKLISCISMKTRNHMDLRFEPRVSP